MFQKILLWLDDLLFPENVACLCSGKALGNDAWMNLCPACTEALNHLFEKQQEKTDFLPLSGIEHSFAAFPYVNQARTLILLLKFNSVRAAAAPLASAMSSLVLPDADMLVPIPTTKRRLRERGFNQSQLLAEELGRALNLPTVSALTRLDERTPQSQLSARERATHLVGCMTADSRVSGKRVLLVDDILTTGSTVIEAARALHAADAKSVNVLVAAKTNLDEDELPFLPKHGIFPKLPDEFGESL